MDEALGKFSRYRSLPWITSSDAHQLEDIGRKTIGLYMNHASFEELTLVLRGAEGRKVLP
jgi:PHP family Zn ribbon phosphoesterase